MFARLFSALSIAAVLAGAFVAWAPERARLPAPLPPAIPIPALPPAPPPPLAPATRLPLPRIPFPDLHWPRFPRPAPAPEPKIASPIQRILVEKAARRMTVWQADGPSKVYPIALGFAPDGDKSRQGDGRTPEGVVRIDRLHDRSAYHLSLGLDYPQPRHRAAARRLGQDPGGDIMIHGQPNQLPDGTRVPGDWTAGCIAVTDAQIEELFAHTTIGTEVEIRP